MKRKLVAILPTVIAGIAFGYLFVISLLLGFLVGKYVAGESIGKQGKLASIVIPVRKWRLHLHHWLYSLWLIGLSAATGIHVLNPNITYGLLGGLAFQGVYCYSDWYIILVSRRQARVADGRVDRRRKRNRRD